MQGDGNNVFSLITIKGGGDQFKDLVGIRIRLHSANRFSPLLRSAGQPVSQPAAELLPTHGVGAQR